MRNAKKTLSLVMIAIFTTFIVLSGIPASAVTKAAAAKTKAAKTQVLRATSAVVKVEIVVRTTTFNPTTATTLLNLAVKETTKIKTYGHAYSVTYNKLVVRMNTVRHKISARKVAMSKTGTASLLAAAQKAVNTVEALTNEDTYDLVGSDSDLANAQNAVTASFEAIVKLNKDSADYKGLMARVDAANQIVMKAMDDRDAAAAAAQAIIDAKNAADALAAAQATAVTAADAAVTMVEAAPLATQDNVTAAVDLQKYATTTAAVVLDPVKTATYTARLAAENTLILAAQAKLDKATADAAAAAAAALLPAKIVTVSAVDGTITVTFDKALIATQTFAKTDFTVTRTVTTDSAVTSTIVPTTVTTNGAVVTFAIPAVAATAVDQKVTYNVAYTTGSAIAAPAYTVAAISPLAATATATNRKEVVVTFNQTVDATSAVVPGNYTGLGTVVPVLQADNKTVILTVTTPLGQQSSNTLTITGVLSASTGLYPTLTVSFTALDVTVPATNTVAVTGPNTLAITFSEPVVVGGTITLDNNTYSVSSPVAGADTHTLNITIPTLPVGAHTVTVSGVKDYNGFTAPDATLSFNYVTDLTLPTVSVTSASQNSVTLTFSKPITQNLSLTNLSVYHTYDGVLGYKGTITSNDGTTVVVSFPNNYLPLGTAKIFVDNTDAVNLPQKDAWGNIFANTTLTTSVAADLVAPAITSVVYTAPTSIAVTYSKDITAGTATNAVNYTLKNSAGTVVPFSGSITYGTVGTVANVATIPVNLVPDTYTLTIANITANNVATTPMSTYTTSFAVANSAIPVISSAVYSADFTKLFVTFNKPVVTSGAYSVLDTNKYNVVFNSTTPAGVELSSITGATIGADSASSVVITFPVAQTYTGSPVVSMSRILDTTGLYSAVYLTHSINSSTVASTDVSNEKVIAVNKVSFDVDAPLTTIDVHQFFFDGTQATSATYVNTATTSTVTLTAATNVYTSDLTTSPSAVIVKIGAMTNNKGIAVASQFNLPTALDYVAPTITARTATTAGAITITFDEPLYAASLAYNTFTVAGQTVSNVALSTDGKTVTLTLSAGLTLSSTVSVQMVKPVMDNSVQHNVLSAETVGTSVTVTP